MAVTVTYPVRPAGQTARVAVVTIDGKAGTVVLGEHPEAQIAAVIADARKVT